METKIGIFTIEELRDLDCAALAFIHQESSVRLQGVINTSIRISDRAYALLGLAVAACSLMAVANPSKLAIVALVGFCISVYYVVRVAKPFKSDLNGMTPKDMQKHIQWGANDLHKDALLLSIYSNQDKIEYLSESNTDRIANFTKGFTWLFFSCASYLILTFCLCGGG